MIKVGITGGIGTGKTTVCKVFEQLGVSVYYADDESKKLLDSDRELKENIALYFGKEILFPTGIIDRKKLATLVFKDKVKLEKLNSFIHPRVYAHFLKWCDTHVKEKYILKEAAILFETALDKQLDKIITVTAPRELKISRVVKRDRVNAEDVLKRMNSQMSDEEKIKLSQFVIYNDEQQLVLPQVLQIHEQLSRA